MLFLTTTARYATPLLRSFGSRQISYNSTDMPCNRVPGEASGTQSVAHRRGRSFTTSQDESTELAESFESARDMTLKGATGGSKVEGKELVPCRGWGSVVGTVEVGESMTRLRRPFVKLCPFLCFRGVVSIDRLFRYCRRSKGFGV